MKHIRTPFALWSGRYPSGAELGVPHALWSGRCPSGAELGAPRAPLLVLMMVHPSDLYKHFGAFLHMMVHSLDHYKQLGRQKWAGEARGYCGRRSGREAAGKMVESGIRKAAVKCQGSSKEDGGEWHPESSSEMSVKQRGWRLRVAPGKCQGSIKEAAVKKVESGDRRVAGMAAERDDKRTGGKGRGESGERGEDGEDEDGEDERGEGGWES